MLGKPVEKNQRMVHALTHVGDVERGPTSAHVPVGPGSFKLDRASGNQGIHLRVRSFAAFLRARLEYKAPAGLTASMDVRSASSARPVRRTECET